MALRALGLGDLLTAVPALRALDDAFGADHDLRLATAPALAPLVAMARTRFAVVGTRGLDDPLSAEARGADVAVNLHGRGPQSHRALLATGPGSLIAFAHPEVDVAGPAWCDDEHEAVRWCRLLAVAGVPADPARLALERPVWPGPGPADDATVIHPGAAYGAKRWPAARFAAVARAERTRGRPVVITGDAADRQLAQRVAAEAGLGPEAVLAGRTSIAQLAAVVAHAGRVVCGDTGVAHVATAFAVPSVVLFGPVGPARWGPPAGGPHRALWAGPPGDPFASHPAPALLALGVDEVLAALDA